MSVDMMRCCESRNDLPRSEFNKRKLSPDGLQHICRTCQRGYYQRNKTHIQGLKRANKERLRQEQAALVLDYLESHPCVDCGETDLVVLEFDHCRDEKFAGVATMIGSYSTRAVLEEIAKCDVVCANCHVRRTAKRAGWPRHLAAAAQG